MPSDIYWIEHSATPRLAIMARPRAGDWLEDEIDHWKVEGVQLVVSLLEPDEINDLGLKDEPGLCTVRGIEFLSFPIPDRGVPADPHDVLRLVRRIHDAGITAAIHCRAGIGRSSLIAASVLAASGIDVATAFELIAAARGVPVPDTDRQRVWVEAFVKQLPAAAR